MNTRRLITLMLLAFIGWSAQAQTKFQKCIGGALGNDYALGAKQTSDGGYIVGGYTNSFGAGLNDAYLIKLTASGDTSWIKTYGGTSDDNALCVIPTNDGGYILAGQTYSFGLISSNVFIIKTNSMGDTLWTRIYGGNYVCVANAIEQTADSGYVIAVTTYRTSNPCAEIIKVDGSGTLQWSQILLNNGSSYIAQDVHQTSDGGYIVLGSATSITSGNYKYFMVKLGSAGDTLWTKTYGGSGIDVGSSIQQTSDHGYIMIGYSNSFGAGGYDIYVIKTDSIGNATWAKTYGGLFDESGASIKQTPDGGYILLGSTKSFSAGGYDVYLIKINSSGVPTWSKTYGGSADDVGYSVNLTSDGGYIIAGYNSSFGAGFADVFVIKTDANGNSGCYQNTASTAFATANTVSYNYIPILQSTEVSGNPAPIIGGGATISDLCNNAGILQITNETSITIAPNPFTNQAVLTLNGSYHNPSLLIYNIMGQEVEMQSITSLHANGNKQFTINRNNLPTGMYFYIVMEENKEVIGVGKMLVE